MLLKQPDVEILLSHCRFYRPNTAGIEDSKMHGVLCDDMYIEPIDIHSMIQHRLASQQINKGGEENQTEHQVASEVPTVGEICQPHVEEFQVSINMINQAQAISDYISEGLEPKYDVEEQWYYMDELGKLAFHELETSPEDLNAHPDYISAEANYHSWPPILNKEKLRHLYPECFYGIGKF